MTGPMGRHLAGTIASAAAGDDAAFARIVAAYHEDMRRVCVVVCRDETIADEAVQAAWSIAWRKLDSVRDPQRLRPWLVSVAVNEAKQLMRKQRRRTRIEALSDPLERRSEIDPALRVGSIDLHTAMKRLDPDDQALLAMRYLVGFNATELAAGIGLSPPGTRARLARVIERLREELGDG